jgi:hypothetical protein
MQKYNLSSEQHEKTDQKTQIKEVNLFIREIWSISLICFFCN